METEKRKTVASVIALLLAGAAASGTRAWAAGKEVPAPPDFTQGAKPVGDEAQILKWKHWAMGPTGASVWIWAAPKTICSDGATQIYVVQVAPETPAAGKLRAGDVILGAAGGTEAKPFAQNARREVAAAISEAETAGAGGKLSLLVWRAGPSAEPRAGKTVRVELTLPVMGAFGGTAPGEDPKTTAIVDQTAASIVKQGLKGGIPGCLDALGLLATGEAKYRPAVRELAHDLGNPDRQAGYREEHIPNAWNTAYQLIFLSEYYLATHDEYVLPTLETLATMAAKGCSGVGTWGHGYAWPEMNNGQWHGALGGYGAMNATGVPMTIGLVLTRKCGIRNDDIEWAVRQSSSFLRFFVDKGGIPYGDHDPWVNNYSNNGKNSEAAVLFDLLGDSDAASYFASLDLASILEREKGHTGPYFSMVWGALGAACGGDDAGAAFMKKMRWYYELWRRPGGDFRYQPVLMGGQEHRKYIDWSCAGVALMHYCLPRKAIHLTGKGGRAAPPLTTEAIEACFDVAPADIYANRTTDQLLKLLAHRLPTTRQRAAAELAKRDENVAPRLVAMLRGENRYARYGACEGLRYASRDSAEAADALMDRLLHSDDFTLRYYAAWAFAAPRGGQGFAKEARRVAPALLKVAVLEDPADSHRKLQAALSGILFYGGNARHYAGIFPAGKGIATLDRTLLIPAVKSWLTNSNGDTRSMVSALYPRFTEQDLEALWGDIYRAAKYRAPSGVMFSGGVQINGVKLMADHRFKEGMDLAVQLMLEKRWGLKGRFKQALQILTRYGSAAKSDLPEIKGMYPALKGHFKSDPAYQKSIEDLVEKIEQSEEAPKLQRMKKHLAE